MSKQLGALYAALAAEEPVTAEMVAAVPEQHRELLATQARTIRGYLASGGPAHKAADQALSHMCRVAGIDRPNIIITGTGVES